MSTNRDEEQGGGDQRSDGTSSHTGKQATHSKEATGPALKQSTVQGAEMSRQTGSGSSSNAGHSDAHSRTVEQRSGTTEHGAGSNTVPGGSSSSDGAAHIGERRDTTGQDSSTVQHGAGDPTTSRPSSNSAVHGGTRCSSTVEQGSGSSSSSSALHTGESPYKGQGANTAQRSAEGITTSRTDSSNSAVHGSARCSSTTERGSSNNSSLISNNISLSKQQQ